jgi:hypothetical protein
MVIEDLTQSPIFIGSDALEVLLNEGVRSVQSTPLVRRSGKLLGIIFTHFSHIRALSEHELILIDILARQAADIIKHDQEEHTRRNNRILEGINKIFSIVVVSSLSWIFFASAENVVSVCGEAMHRWERVIVEDFETSPLFVGTPSSECDAKGWSMSGSVHSDAKPHWHFDGHSHNSMGCSLFSK